MLANRISTLLFLTTVLGACVDEPDEEIRVEDPVGAASTTSATTARALAPSVRGTFTSTHAEGTRQIQIAYAIVRAQTADKGAIVIANGRTETFEQYGELAEDLSRRGYTLYLIDHRGQGHSDRTLPYTTVGDGQYQKGAVDDFDEYTDDLQTFVTQVVRPDRVGKRRTLYGLGHSMGGTILSLYALQHPAVFDKLVLTSPMFELDVDTGIGFDYMVWAHPNDYAKGGPWERPAFGGNALTSSRPRFDAKQAVFSGDRSLRVGGPTYHWVDRALEAADDVRDNSDRIDVPVLLFSAVDDRVVVPHGHRVVCDHINTAHPGGCRLVKMLTSRHEPLIEVDAIRAPVLDRIERFLDQP